MNEKQLQEYAQSAQSSVKKHPRMGKSDARESIISKFVELIGWNESASVAEDYSINRLGDKIDYALIIGSEPVAFIQMKGINIKISADHRERFKHYLREEGVSLGIMTNVKQYEFYHLPAADSTQASGMVDRSALQHLPSKNKLVEAYEIDKIQQGESADIIDNITEVIQLKSSLEKLVENKQKLATNIASRLIDNTSAEIESIAESQAEMMLDRFIAEIESEITAVQNDNRKPDLEVERKSSAISEPYSTRIIRDGDIVEVFGHSVQSQLMTSIINYLIKHHNLINNINSLPYRPSGSRPIIHSSPETDRHEMSRPKKLNNGYYIESKLRWKKKKREIKRLANRCGLEAVFDTNK
jgi:hypothetical protein